MGKSCNVEDRPGVIRRLVVIGGTVGVAMLSYRVTRLFLSGLVIGLQRSRGKNVRL